MISLLNAGLWPWVFVAGVPLLIHLLTRRARTKSDLPTARFLRKSVAQQSKFWRWRQLLVLLLRMLAVAALVFAFAKPTWVSPLARKPGERTGAVVLLDVSLSMGYTGGGVSTLSKAKSAAIDAISGLRTGDQASLVLCGAQASVPIAEPTIDLSVIQSAIKAATVTEERADAAGAVATAVEQLAKTNADGRRLYIVSDFQRTNWSNVKFDDVPANTKIIFVSVDGGDRENLGITSLRTRPALPRVGETVTVQAEVFNSSRGPHTVPVNLALSDGQHYAKSVSVGPYSSANVSFPVAFDHPERVEVTATLPADNLAADNVRRAVIDLQQMATVVLITNEDVNAPTSATYYLARALHPDLKSNSGFRVVTVKPEALNNPILKSADAVIVCSAPSMPAEQYEALARYTTNGGNLVWMLYGDRTPLQLADFAKHLPKSEPMPIHGVEMLDLAGRAKGFVSLRRSAPTTAAFSRRSKDTAAQSLTKVKFTKLYITGEVDPRAELLLKYEDGTAAALRTGEGSGNLLLLNMSPAPSWSDLARQPVFLPLMHEFLKGILLKDAAQREVSPGGSVSTTIVPTNAKLTCMGPDNKPIAATLDKTTGSVIVDDAKLAGFYRLWAGPDAVATMAVNPHADESDLRPIDPRELESVRQKEVSYLATAAGEGGARDVDRGEPLWQYALLAAVLFLLCEQALARIRPKVAARAAR